MIENFVIDAIKYIIVSAGNNCFDLVACQYNEIYFLFSSYKR